MRWLSVAVTAVLSAALIAGIFVPVYTDEIGWRFQERAGFDGVDKMFSEVCGPNTLAAPVWFMWPVRWFSAILNGAFADPFWVRISGIVYALLWVVLTVQLVRRLTDDRTQRALLSVVGLGLAALGTMPLLMVWSRPEQPIVLAAFAAVIIAFADPPAAPRPSSTGRQAWSRSLAIAALIGIAISYHVKGLFLLPLMLACLFYASRGPRAHLPRLIAGALMLAMVVSAMPYWQDRLACPQNATLAYSYAAHNISGAIVGTRSLHQAAAMVGKLIHNIDIIKYIANIVPIPWPMSAWLENHQIAESTSVQWFRALVLVWGLALLVAAVAAVASAVRGLRERRIDPRLVLAVLAFGIAAAWSSTQLVRNVYESKFVLPLLILAIVLALSTRMPERLKSVLSVAAVLIGLLALASPFAIGAIYGPSLARAATQAGYIAEQRYSVSVFGAAKLRPDIEAAAKLCGIDSLSRSHAVMVDDLTYFPMMKSTLPQHHLGVIGMWSGRVDPVDYLKSRHADGMVVGCHLLPPGLRGRAKAVGKFCCLGPPNW